MNIYDMSINEYLDLAASASPTPGGGSVSAVVAANASAMISMVANLTLGKKGYEDVQEEIKSILESMREITQKIKELTEKDIFAFQKFMEAWRMPSDSDGDKVKKRAAMEKAAQNASLIPLELCRTCLDILRQALKIAPIGNKTAISDVGVGVYLSEASLKAAILSVDINLGLIRDDSFRREIQTERSGLITEAGELMLLALANVKQRL